MSITYQVTVDQYGTYWKLNGLLHREDGPAIERSDGHKEWCQNGRYHREDGPACEWTDGSKSWYLNDVYHTEEEFNARMNPAKEMTDIDLLKLALEVFEWSKIMLRLNRSAAQDSLDDVIAKIKTRLENEDA